MQSEGYVEHADAKAVASLKKASHTGDTSSKVVGIAIALAVIGITLSIVGMTTLHWTEFHDNDNEDQRTIIGLLKCLQIRKHSERETDIDHCLGEDSERNKRLTKGGIIVLACGSIGLFFAFIGMVGTAMHGMSQSMRSKMIAIFFSLFAAAMTIGGTFGYSSQSFVGYSFVLFSFSSMMIVMGFLVQGFGGKENAMTTKTGLVVVLIGAACCIAGMATPMWTVERSEDGNWGGFGLTHCKLHIEKHDKENTFALSSDECKYWAGSDDIDTIKHAASLGLPLGCTGIILALLALVVQGVGVAMNKDPLRFISILMGIVGGIILFGGTYAYSHAAWIGYSFILFSNSSVFFTMTAGSLFFSTAVAKFSG